MVFGGRWLEGGGWCGGGWKEVVIGEVAGVVVVGT